jgi:aldehyde dehydrogenase (NAD+)
MSQPYVHPCELGPATKPGWRACRPTRTRCADQDNERAPERGISEMIEPNSNYIGGRFEPVSAGESIDVWSPSTGEKWGTIGRSTGKDVDLAVRSAAGAQPAWAALRPIARARILMRIADYIRTNVEQFAEVEYSQTGKVRQFVNHEINAAADYFELYAGLCNVPQGERIDIGGDFHCYTRREPYGVVGIITPWNSPLGQLARGLAPALAVGNAVVGKPSEFTSGTSLMLAQAAVEHCGLPAGLFNIVTGLGPEAGAALAGHPLVRKIAFTGSVRAGREIGHIAADRIIPLNLELGGKSANIIFEDADIDAAVRGAVLAIALNSGQVCWAGSRLLVHRPVYERVLTALAEFAQGFRSGPGEGCMMGAITTRAQYDRVRSYFDVAAADGARLLVGGPDVRDPDWGNGWYVPLTIYADVSNDMRIAREEIFGPVLSVIPFDAEEEAIAIANDSDYGLLAGIWTTNLSRAHRVAAQIQAGNISINEYTSGDVELPFGGFKNSGYGKEKGAVALEHYSHLKTVRIRL